jgi:hypothetical protein
MGISASSSRVTILRVVSRKIEIAANEPVSIHETPPGSGWFFSLPLDWF